MSYRLIKFFNPEAINEETGEKGVWQSVAVCEDKGEKGDKGDPFTYEDFTPEQLEGLRGYVFTPSVDEEGNISWTNDGDLSNPATVNIRGYDAEIIYSNIAPENTSALWVVEEEDSGNVGKDVVTSNSVNRIEIVDEYPETLEENVLYIKVK